VGVSLTPVIEFNAPHRAQLFVVLDQWVHFALCRWHACCLFFCWGNKNKSQNSTRGYRKVNKTFINLVLLLSAVSMLPTVWQPYFRAMVQHGVVSKAYAQVAVPTPSKSAAVSKYKDDPALAIQFEVDDLTVKTGDYVEVGVSLKGFKAGDVEWEILDRELPLGLQLEDTTKETLSLFGTPSFQGQWCFALSAKTVQMTQTVKEICFVAEGNDQLTYMKFKTDRFLKDGYKRKKYQTKIEFDSGAVTDYKGRVELSWLQNGLKLEYNEGKGYFLVKGKASETGVANPVVTLIDNISGYETAKQFQLEILEKEIKGAACPSGYYFDQNLRYCVQNKLDTCPSGTFYEPENNACVAYPQAPPTVYCGAGSYYDHYLNSCVRLGSPRCPLNYRWDTWYNRCVRLSYTCPIGTSYSYVFKECTVVWGRVCSIGWHWNSYY